MNGACGSVKDQILAAIENGKLSREETERRLVALIDAEAAKRDAPADMALVNACEDLLMALHTHGTMTFESNMLANQAAVQERRRACGRGKALSRGGRALAVVAAAIVVLVGVCGGLRWRWLSGSSTPDGQQYVIQQQEIGIETIQRAIAEHTGVTEITTEDRDSFVSFLGFEPKVPEVIREKWTAKGFYAMIFPDLIQITVRYGTTEESKEDFNYSMLCYTSLNNAYSTFEQDVEGNQRIYQDIMLYESNNSGRTSLSWRKDTVVYYVSGNLSLEEGRSIVDELIGGVET